MSTDPVILSRPMIDDATIAAVERVLRSGMLAAGPEVAAFETEFADWVGVDHAIAVANGTLALWIGMLAAAIEPGDEIVIPSFTFAGTASSVIMAGATPVYADIDPATYCITAATVEPVLSARTRAVMPVHLYGHPARLDELEALCSERGIELFEDAAQAHGAKLDGRAVGGWGTFGAFSFYPTKNMTTGEGGMVTTNDESIAEAARRIRNHGMAERYHHISFGTNARMSDIGAAIGRRQLELIEGWNKQRIEHARHLDDELASHVATPPVEADAHSVYHQYTVRTSERARLIASLNEHGIGHGIYYPKGCHEQPAYRDPGARLPVTEQASSEVVSLPVRPDLTDAEIDRIVTAVKEAT